MLQSCPSPAYIPATIGEKFNLARHMTSRVVSDSSLIVRGAGTSSIVVGMLHSVVNRDALHKLRCRFGVGSDRLRVALSKKRLQTQWTTCW